MLRRVRGRVGWSASRWFEAAIGSTGADARPDDAAGEDEEERGEVVPEREAVGGAHVVVEQVEGHERAEAQHDEQP